MPGFGRKSWKIGKVNSIKVQILCEGHKNGINPFFVAFSKYLKFTISQDLPYISDNLKAGRQARSWTSLSMVR